MMSDSPQHDALRSAHLLALELIERLRKQCGTRVLEIGRGSGRNSDALAVAGYRVVEFEDAEPVKCAGAISTHALLHGTPESIAEMLRGIADRVEIEAPFYATFGSSRDARCGAGARLGPQTFASLDGDEAGIAHTFFDEAQLRDVLSTHWTIESLEEHAADTTAGTWAHRERPLSRSVHWFAKLHRR